MKKLISQAEEAEKMLRGKLTGAATIATLASYEVAFELVKNMVPFSHGELV